jgi:uncharacterized protein YecE (DUF72 family)
VTVLCGTSGFQFDAWREHFYPEDLASNRMLEFYAARLPTVEINYTFYRTPTDKTFDGWLAQTPDSFRFALKASQRITHRARLKDAEEPTAFFCEKAKRLGDKLGPVLFQLPPNLKKDAERLRTFVTAIPAGIRAAFEFRHASWFDDETFETLRGVGAALCIAQDEKLSTPPVRTADFGYLRLRLPDYDDTALRAWSERLRALAFPSDVYVFFKHEAAAHGTKLAHRLGSLSTPPTG